jgi:hypothetical protein
MVIFHSYVKLPEGTYSLVNGLPSGNETWLENPPFIDEFPWGFPSHV